MNDDSRPEPLPDDARDELLSADLDGELPAAAADFGLSPEAARRRIAATPGANERRQELAGAQAVGAHVEGIDELLAARLRAKALRAGAEARAIRERERRRRVRRVVRGTAAAVAAAAAVLVAIAIVAALVRGNSPHTNSSSTAASVTTPSTEPNAPAPSQRFAALGSYTDAQGLTAAVSDSVRRDRAAAANRAQSTAGAASRPAAGGRCAAEFDRLSGAGEPILDSSALVAGRPVYVRAYVQADKAVVVVLSGDCRLLARRVDTH